MRTRPGVILLVPAPGVDGQVQSYFEDGCVGVVAALSIPHPEYGFGSGSVGDKATAAVDPTMLELRKPGIFTPDEVQEAIRRA